MPADLRTLPVLIDAPDRFAELVKQLTRQPRIAVDTESNSLHAYRERVCLIQFSTPDTDYVLDPLALQDLSALGPIFSSTRIEKIFHASEYDIICLRRDYGFSFANIFDTMQAGRILGRKLAGLDRLLEEKFEVKVNKRFQKADWAVRPLSNELLMYARLDTHYLIRLRDMLKSDLKKAGLWQLAQEDFVLACHPNGAKPKLDAPLWTRYSGRRELNVHDLTVLGALLDWRDQMAEELDRPAFKVVEEDRLIEIAVAKPTTNEELVAAGLTNRQVQSWAEGILEAVRKGQELPVVKRPVTKRPDDAYLKRLDKLKEWRKKAAAKMDVESDVVLPRSMLLAIAEQGATQVRTVMQASPWRLEHFGEEIRNLLGGEMQLDFHGAAQTVTGSQHLLEINGTRLLLDCGMFQGRRSESYARNMTFAFDAQSVDAVILSHAHIDHSGNLPSLIRHGFKGDIFTTAASADLADIMLRDAGHIQEADAAFLNKRRHSGEALIEPLYTMADAEQVAGHFHSVGYNERFEPVPGVTAEMFDAGHILGSAGMLLELNEKGRTVRLWFSGDIGRMNLPLLMDPVMPKPADYLLMECTYGDTPHHEPREAFEAFRQVVTRTIGRGGKVIIPAFAVGRTQELVFDLNELVSTGQMRHVPVYVDSPLAVNTSDVFRRHTECFDEETRTFVKQSKHPALEFQDLTYIRSVDESKALNGRKDPMIIIAASGMAETGRILHHLKNNIGDPRNTILIVSYQAPETLGRHLAEGDRQVRIYGEPYDVKAEVASIEGLSAHAGQDLLIKYATTLKGQARKTFLVHGEPDAAEALTGKLKEQGMSEIYYPALHSSVEL